MEGRNHKVCVEPRGHRRKVEFTVTGAHGLEVGFAKFVEGPLVGIESVKLFRAIWCQRP